MNIKDFKWTEKRFGTRFANILKKLGGLSKDGTDGSIEYKDDEGNITKLVTDSNFSSLLAKNGLIEVKWQELKDKRDNGQLIPGSLYRITNYQCTTTQENTQSAGHQFDIVLLALSEDKLAEEGWAMMNESNVYDVIFDDGVTKKCWYFNSETEGICVIDYNTLLGIDGLGDIEINEEIKTITNIGCDSTELTIPDLTYNYFQNSNLSAWKVWYCLDNDKSRFAWADPVNGKGVIYRLIDEFNNDIKYDFKNIQFKRKLTNGQYDATNGTDTWCYTLNVWYNDMCQDASIVGNTLTDDEYKISGVRSNSFGCTIFDYPIEEPNTITFALNDNVILSIIEDSYYYGIYDNNFGEFFNNNTIGSGCDSNIIGNHSNGNIIRNGFRNNSIGNYFISNSIGDGFEGNVIGGSFNSNNINGAFMGNFVANSFEDITISSDTRGKNYGNHGVELATKDDIGNIETALSNI